MTFKIGQIFEGEYPPEAAVWCNEHQDCYIDEIEQIGCVRRFQIVAVPEPTDEDVAAQMRAERDRKITKTDYYMMSDYPISKENLDEVKAYRQALRDITEQTGFPKDVIWPDVPKFLYKESDGRLGLAKVGI